MDTSKITVEEFAENYESRHVPVVLTVRLHVGPRLENVLYVLHLSTLSVDYCIMLLKKYRSQRFKCGEGEDGRSVKLKMIF
uniref:Uncharacterized protein n=1 Tax=Wuchereria bancrofti TaxID=6293 RepID=A0A1I8EM65_WUCBA